ncbi:hypothetical protein [Streptosporangium jomthongense]|uniref:Uncharacterized protein n=1 Tax=Streptosporangium jomthongense TaxID=1193683 RepID=A0ABV8F4W4_9ACTN
MTMSFLDEVLKRLHRKGVLIIMIRLIREVYRVNADRFEPELGDDRTLFGIAISRNIANRAVTELRGLPGVHAKLVNSALEIVCDGFVVRQYKLPGSSVNVSVELIDWTTSEAKLRGPVENSQTDAQLTLDGDEDLGAAFDSMIPLFRHIRFVHSGSSETGNATIHAGIPRDHRDGGSPWLDSRCIWSDDAGRIDGFGEEGDVPFGPTSPVRPPASGPAHSDLPTPEPQVTPRRTKREGQSDA